MVVCILKKGNVLFLLEKSYFGNLKVTLLKLHSCSEYLFLFLGYFFNYNVTYLCFFTFYFNLINVKKFTYVINNNYGTHIKTDLNILNKNKRREKISIARTCIWVYSAVFCCSNH